MAKTHTKVQKAATKAYGLLAEQPSTVVGMPSAKRSQVVISAILDSQGETHVLSRFGDHIWELWPEVTTENTDASQQSLRWNRIAEPFQADCKAILYAYWKQGREGWSRPNVWTLQKNLDAFSTFTRFLTALKVQSFADLHPIHIANFVNEQKGKGLVQSTLTGQFLGVELLHLFKAHAEHGLKDHPWPESSAVDMAGKTGKAQSRVRLIAKTPLIPPDVQQKLFQHAKSVLARADALLDERDAVIRSAYKDPEITAISTACFYLIGCLCGPRSGEISAIRTGAGRTVVKDGTDFHFLTSIEFKTKKGVVDYMMPFMVFEVLRIAERFSEPFRRKIAEQIAQWEALAGTLEYQLVLRKLHRAKQSKDCVFLGERGTVVTVSAWSQKLKDFARDAGVDWVLAPHQLRRLFAYTFVRHRLGNILFLREQFHHSSLSMGQLYAASPRQDAALYDEILQEIHRQKAELVQHWMDSDELLAGGAGEKIMAMRAQDYPSRKALIMETSKDLHLRSTGHSWCLAQDEGCGGGGMYEDARCSGCGNGVIDQSFKPIWQEIYLHQRELLEEVKDMGQGTALRVKRDLAAAVKVLKRLGVSLDREDGDDQSASA